jgi:hypothetical protein
MSAWLRRILLHTQFTYYFLLPLSPDSLTVGAFLLNARVYGIISHLVISDKSVNIYLNLMNQYNAYTHQISYFLCLKWISKASVDRLALGFGGERWKLGEEALWGQVRLNIKPFPDHRVPVPPSRRPCLLINLFLVKDGYLWQKGVRLVELAKCHSRRRFCATEVPCVGDQLFRFFHVPLRGVLGRFEPLWLVFTDPVFDFVPLVGLSTFSFHRFCATDELFRLGQPLFHFRRSRPFEPRKVLFALP